MRTWQSLWLSTRTRLLSRKAVKVRVAWPTGKNESGTKVLRGTAARLYCLQGLIGERQHLLVKEAQLRAGVDVGKMMHTLGLDEAVRIARELDPPTEFEIWDHKHFKE